MSQYLGFLIACPLSIGPHNHKLFFQQIWSYWNPIIKINSFIFFFGWLFARWFYIQTGWYVCLFMICLFVFLFFFLRKCLVLLLFPYSCHFYMQLLSQINCNFVLYFLGNMVKKLYHLYAEHFWLSLKAQKMGSFRKRSHFWAVK